MDNHDSSAAPPVERIAIDTGGTFTDCVFYRNGELQALKVFSTPADPSRSIREAIATIGAAPGAEIRHGTTVGTNALLEGKGARVAFLTTAGFEDVIAIGRQARPALYRLGFAPRPQLVSPDLCFGLDERVLPDGSVHRPLQAAELQAVIERLRAAGPEAVAVSLLFAFANPAHERQVAAALADSGLPVSLSHQILPEFREYERGAAVLINAYLAPKMSRYLERLEQALPGCRLQVMQSSGGMISAATAARQPVRTILSGPAGGVVGAHAVAMRAGHPRILAFDMGGTSTDVALVDGEAGLRTSNESQIQGLPVAIPMLDIHTVGAGGGSLARFDAGQALQVGPQSAGAEPGPICYGRGERPTVTDANLLLGRLDAEGFLGGGLRLDADRARRVFETARGPLASVEVFADGIVRLAEATIEKALRVMSLERGFDPREFTLVSFGGAGPLHAAALAQALQMPRVLVPRLPGALSALGILMSDMVKDFSRTVMLAPPRNEGGAAIEGALQRAFRELEAQGAAEMRAEGWSARAFRSLDMRYQGQGYELNLDYSRDFIGRFHAAHQQRYGYADPARPVEVVNVRVRMVSASPPLPMPRRRRGRGNGRQALARQGRVFFAGRFHRTPIYTRERLVPGDAFTGPAIVTEYSATTVVPPGVRMQVDAFDNLILHVP